MSSPADMQNLVGRRFEVDCLMNILTSIIHGREGEGHGIYDELLRTSYSVLTLVLLS